MKQGIYKIAENRPLTANVFAMTLEGDTSALKRPGQFVNVAVAGKFLRRPISVADYDGERIKIIYKVVGEGTSAMSDMRKGAGIDLLTGLGNGFDTSSVPDDALLAGGGAGVPPLIGLARRLVAEGKAPRVVAGFNTVKEAFGEKSFRSLGVDVTIATVDGSYGVRGYVTTAMRSGEKYVCACGPEAMLRAVYDACEDGQFSFEARMACGFGACMGCSCRTKYGEKRICKDGPVLIREEIIW